MTNPTSQASGVAERAAERAQAEAAYTLAAYNYPRDPVGSRDWTLYYGGWLHRAALATQPAATAEVVKVTCGLCDGTGSDPGGLPVCRDCRGLGKLPALASPVPASGANAETVAMEHDPLVDFQEGQWWVAELDAMARAPGSTDDQKRAVAVVHNFLRGTAALASPAQAPAAPSVGEPVTRDTLRIGGKYNFQYQAERLVYMGLCEPRNGRWHQFALVEAPTVCWCEVRDEDLSSFEETRAALATQPVPAEPVSVLDVDAYVAERIAAEGEQFLGEVAYQLTKRLVIDMPTARAAVDAAFKYVATALAATAPNLVANILKDCCECERPNHWDVETVELRVSDLTMILQRHIEGKE